MNIVEINQTYKRGSTGKIVDQITEYAKVRGNLCLVCSSDSTFMDDRKSTYVIGNAIDHKIHALLSRVFGKQAYFSVLATKKLISRLVNFNPDVVHVHNLHGNFINLQMLSEYLADNNIATVITLHDCWFFTGKCTYFKKCMKWKSSCGQCPLLHIDNVNPTYFLDWTEKSLKDKEKWLSNIHNLTVVGVSKWASDNAKESILKNARHRVVYNGIDCSVFKPSESDIREKYKCENKFIILMVTSYLSEAKGHNELKFLSKLPNEEYQVIVIGRNKNNLSIPDGVIHLEYVANQNELAKYYSSADVCVNTTMQETFGLVTAEAICCGTPVIVYNNTASPELIGKRCGLVIENEPNYENLNKAIRVIADNTKKYYSDSCRKYGLYNFSHEKMLDQYISIYEDAIKGKNDAK